jgi:crotonobetainyl-CoA:carnitine CoA-transferase CaiB-like acyl-CoA transferase
VSGAGPQLRVLECCEGIAGPLCGRHLARLGARVERVEPVGGDRARAWGLHAPGALHALLAEGKHEAGPEALERADVVLADEGRVDLERLPSTSRPRLLVIFEQETLEDGAFVGSESVAQALLGLMDYVGDRWDGPARTGADIASITTAVCGSHVVLAWALAPREAQWRIARVSPLRTLAALKTVVWAARTRPDAWTGSHVVARDRRIDTGYRVDDGWVTIDFPSTHRASWSGLCEALGLGELIGRAGDRWWETVGWGDDVDDARPLFEAALRGLDREQATALVREHGGSSVAFNAPREVLAHEQTRALGTRFGALPWRVLEGNADASLTPPATGDRDDPPLSGIRVVDFGVGGVGPFAAALLASLGADVVKVEAPNEFIHAVRPDADGLASTYSALNVGKRSVELNLKDDNDAEQARSMVARADVVLENFRPGAMDRLGFGYRALFEVNPRLVYLSASGFGSAGPLANLQCTDPHIQAFGGWALSNASSDGSPRRTRYYALLDLVSSMTIVESILAALLRRAQTDQGSHVEVSMLEAVVALHTSRWAGLDSDSAWSSERLFAPDGLFDTTDATIAVSVEHDGQWEALKDALGHPEALRVDRWTTNAGRVADERAIAEALAPLLARQSAQGWLLALSRRGVPVARVTRDDDVVLRRDLWERDYLRPLQRRDRPPLRGGGPPWDLQPPAPMASAPSPGADNATFLARA